MTSRPQVSRIYSLQVMRFVAASMVLFGHAQHETGSLHIAGAFEPATLVRWGSGVDVFFVISGFIMYFLAHENFARKGYSAEFIIRRLIRIAPLYWVFTTLLIAAILVVGDRMANVSLSIPHIVASYLFFPWPHSNGQIEPLLSLGWTLNYEMLFYVLLSIALLFPRKLGLAGLALLFLVGVGLHFVIPDSWFALHYWTAPIILEFLLGIGLAHLYLSGFRLSLPANIFVLLIGIALLVYMGGTEPLGKDSRLLWGDLRIVWGGLPAIFLCAGVIFLEERLARLSVTKRLATLGDASYSLYLSHPFTVNVVAIVWQKVIRWDTPWLFIFVSCFTAIAVSVGIYFLFEKPVLRYLHKRFMPHN